MWLSGDRVPTALRHGDMLMLDGQGVIPGLCHPVDDVFTNHLR